MSKETAGTAQQAPKVSSNSLAAFQKLRVVELGSWLAAPNVGALLADLGAEVIKVESPGGDPLRNFPASMTGGTDKSAAFSLLNRGKKSVVIDIADIAGRRQLEALLSTADVFVTNMRNGALARANLDPGAVHLRHPRLVYASLTGLGLEGPERDLPGMDSGVFWARSGLLNQITAEGSEPLGLLGGYGDLVTSLSMFAAILAGLAERAEAGRGGVVETSLLQTAAWILSGDVASNASLGRAPRPRPRAKVRTPLVNSYRTSDDRWFFLTAVEATRHLPGIARAIECPELITDERFKTASNIRKNAKALIELMDAAFAKRPLAEWAGRFKTFGVWWERVATLPELMQDPQLAPNGMAGSIAWDGGEIEVVTSPFRLFDRPAPQAAAAPLLGQDDGEFQAIDGTPVTSLREKPGVRFTQ